MAQETNNTTGGRIRSHYPDSSDIGGNGGGGGHGGAQQQRHHHHYKDSLKIFVSRIPAHFDEDSIRRLVQEKLQEAAATPATRSTDDDKEVSNSNGNSSVVLAVELAYPNEKSKDDKDKEDDDVGHQEHGDETSKKKKSKPSNNTRTNNNNNNNNGHDDDDDENDNVQQQQQKHKGYGFVVLKDATLVQKALVLGKLRGGAKPTSTRQNYTLYIGPCLTDAEKEEKRGNNNKISHDKSSSSSSSNKQPCFLWTSSGNKHCPYGAACKFQHVGGGDNDSTTTSNNAAARDAAAAADEEKKKRIKCRDHRKNKCKLGADACPFSHDFEPKKSKQQQQQQNGNDDKDDKPTKMTREDSEKDCIGWKSKGKCRKFQNTTVGSSGGVEAKSSSSSTSACCCPYRHDPEVQKAALDKIAERKKKKKRAQNDEQEHEHSDAKRQRQQQQDTIKVKQPLCVRVFGMSYDTTLADVQRAFEPCGKITKIDFPVFDDASRRSKGYCSVTFCTHKSVEKAIIELDGHLEKERWWRVQAGNMLLDQWE